MKQTAVEWFINQLDNNQDKTRQELYYFVEKAKEMEKKQLEKEWRKGYIEGLKDNNKTYEK